MVRTVITKLSRDEEKLVKDIATHSKLAKSTDIVSDIYTFMKNPELIDKGDMVDSLIDEYKDGKVEYYLQEKKRLEGRLKFFNMLLEHPYYAKFKEKSPDESAMIILDMLNAFIKDKKVDKEEDEDGKEPSKTEARFKSIIEYGVELFNLFDDEYFRELLKKRGVAEQEITEPKNMPALVNKIVSEMSQELVIYELSKRLDFTIRTTKKGKFNQVFYPDNGLDVTKIIKTSDITKLFPSQLALDTDLFYKKLMHKELLMKKYMQRQEKRQVLYMLVDCSGSMEDSSFKGLRKIDVCKAVAISLMKKMIDNEDTFYFRWFNDNCGSLHTVKTKKESLTFMSNVIYGCNPSGGTNIERAIYQAANDIKGKVIGKWDEADILLVSDGEANISVPDVNKKIEGIDLHTIQIVDREFNPQDIYMSQCKQISKNFLMTKCKNNSDVVEIANLFSK